MKREEVFHLRFQLCTEPFVAAGHLDGKPAGPGDRLGVAEAGEHVLRRRLEAEVRVVDDAGEGQTAGGLDLGRDLQRVGRRPRERARAVHDQQHLVVALGADGGDVAPQRERAAVVAADVEHAAGLAAVDELVGFLRHGARLEADAREVGQRQRGLGLTEALGDAQAGGFFKLVEDLGVERFAGGRGVLDGGQVVLADVLLDEHVGGEAADGRNREGALL